MHLIQDIKNDPSFKKSTYIIFGVLLAFMVLDALTGTLLTKGLNRYYGLNSNAEIALVGHSHLMLGVDKTVLENELDIPVAKYTREGVNIADRQIMIRQLLRENSKIKTVIYGVDAWSFSGEGLSANSHTLFYPFLKNTEVNNYVKRQADPADYWLHKIIKTARFSEGLISSSFRGYLNNWSNLKFGKVDVDRLKKEIAAGQFRKIHNSPENISILKASINELQTHGIKVILLYVPTIDLYNRAEPEKFKESMEIIKDLPNEFDNVQFVNYLEPLSHDYSLFFDPIHMNPKGQKQVTQQLINDLRELNEFSSLSTPLNR